jgi:NAD(P)-dependent dehydrogenase (short-subunit alcohol dehydrogenase family)
VAQAAKTLANEQGQSNITVNTVLPGATHRSFEVFHLLKQPKKTGASVEMRQHKNPSFQCVVLVHLRSFHNGWFSASPAEYVNGEYSAMVVPACLAP